MRKEADVGSVGKEIWFRWYGLVINLEDIPQHGKCIEADADRYKNVQCRCLPVFQPPDIPKQEPAVLGVKQSQAYNTDA